MSKEVSVIIDRHNEEIIQSTGYPSTNHTPSSLFLELNDQGYKLRKVVPAVSGFVQEPIPGFYCYTWTAPLAAREVLSEIIDELHCLADVATLERVAQCFSDVLGDDNEMKPYAKIETALRAIHDAL